jgi:hypothetical protein
MATTARDQINGALRLIGMLAEGESPSAATSQDALTAMNQMKSSRIQMPSKDSYVSIDAGCVKLNDEDKYNENSDKPNIAEILIEKHRNGPTGKVELYFDDKKASFLSMEKSDFGDLTQVESALHQRGFQSDWKKRLAMATRSLSGRTPNEPVQKHMPFAALGTASNKAA